MCRASAFTKRKRGVSRPQGPTDAKTRDPGPTDTFLWPQNSNRGHHDYRGSRGVFGSSRAHDHPTRFHRASALQELRGIASVSAGRPLFIPFLRIVLDTPETARSGIHRGFRAMARPGLEPGTPRFSVVDRNRSNRVESPAVPGVHIVNERRDEVRNLHSFLVDSGTGTRLGA